ASVSISSVRTDGGKTERLGPKIATEGSLALGQDGISGQLQARAIGRGVRNTDLGRSAKAYGSRPAAHETRNPRDLPVIQSQFCRGVVPTRPRKTRQPVDFQDVRLIKVGQPIAPLPDW